MLGAGGIEKMAPFLPLRCNQELRHHDRSAAVQMEKEGARYSEEGPLVYTEGSESFSKVSGH